MKSSRSNRGNVTRVRDLYSSGQSLRSIAEETGMKEERISQIIKENGVPKRSSRIKTATTAHVESAEFLNFLQYLKPICWSWKMRTFKQLLEKYAKDTGSDFQYSYSWRQDYVKQHENVLPARIVELMSSKTAKGSTRTMTREEFFETISNLYQQLGVEEMPHSIWTFDAIEVELPEPPKKKKRDSDATNALALAAETSHPESVTALCAVSASGSLTMGSLLFKGVRIATEWKSQLSDADKEKVILLVNGSGRCDVLALLKWLKSVFIKKVVCRPVVLFLSSEFCSPDYYEFLKYAFEEQIHVVSVPSKLPNVKLPLAVFARSVFKDRWYEGLDDQQLNVSPASPITRAQVVETFIPAQQTLTGVAAKDAFRDVGLYPLNPTACPSEQPELAMDVDEDMIEITLDPPLSPETQEAVDEAMAVFARAGVSQAKARKLLRHMSVPGFATAE